MTPTIALVGSGEYLEVCRPVDEHLLSLVDAGERAPRVACLPTAAAKDGEWVWRGWQERGVAHFTRLGAEAVAVDVIDRRTADDDAMVRNIAGADLVYLSGVKPALLHQLLEGTAAWSAILGVLDRGGVLAGCSAGAMVQGSHIAGLRGGPGSTGFGLLADTIVLPHFDEYPSLAGDVVNRLIGRGRNVVGVDGATALVRHQDQFRAVGRGSVSVWGPRGKDRFHDEDLPEGIFGIG
ncbi:MAG: Type 1 glutamine amidotransferase-like domain-containing protein [Actinomycetota bacterium]|nr:Type 1 glutamine amidotransferase-like domain-containing protein [Actinomycetota bacterium]